MHPEAYKFLEETLSDHHLRFGDGVRVLEFGSRDVNGSPRQLFTSNVHYIGVDIAPGPGVDVVGDAADIVVKIGGVSAFDVVICMEVAEHTPRWKEIVANASAHLAEGGLFIFTAACDPRLPHSAVDGHNMEVGEYYYEIEGYEVRSFEATEWYQNIDPMELVNELHKHFTFTNVSTHPRGDVYGKATA